MGLAPVRKIMTEKIRTLRNGGICCLIFLACYWAAWPVSNMGFVDDWSYAKTAEVFANTGHLVYNGWATAMLGWQIPWGALFIKLFGFSFMTVKLSMLPVALGCLLLFYAILTRFEIAPRNAMIGTLTIGLSPLFMPLAASYMSDIPGLFVILLCLYCCQRAVRAESDRAAIAWLVVAAATNVAGGTARQVAWLGVLVMVPCTGWLLRKRRGVLALAMVLWVAGLGCVLYCMHWFAQQPYAITTTTIRKHSHALVSLIANTVITGDMMMAQGICLLLIAFPVLVAWLPKFGRKLDHYVVLLRFGLLPMVVMEILTHSYAVIWPPHVLYKELSMRRDAGITWHRDAQRLLIPSYAQLALSLFLIAALIGCIYVVQNKWREMRDPDRSRGHEMFWLLVPYCLSYFMLLLPLAWNTISFDRYMLGVMPCAIIALIWLYERCIGPRLPVSSVVWLVIFGCFGVAGTHDWFAWQRARLAAIHELRSAGIPRRNIEGGFEYDGWTQVRDGGYIHDERIKIPAGAVKPDLKPANRKDPCLYSFLREVPDVVPKYSVAIGPKWCDLPSEFPAVHYTSWIPPFRRTIYVRKVANKGE